MKFIKNFCNSELNTRSEEFKDCLNDGQEEARMESPRQEKSQKFCVAALRKNATYAKIESCFKDQQRLYQDLNEPALAKCVGVTVENDNEYPQAQIDLLNKDI